MPVPSTITRARLNEIIVEAAHQSIEGPPAPETLSNLLSLMNTQRFVVVGAFRKIERARRCTCPAQAYYDEYGGTLFIGSMFPERFDRLMGRQDSDKAKIVEIID